MKFFRSRIFVLNLTLACACVCAFAHNVHAQTQSSSKPIELDTALPEYRRIDNVSGKIRSVGSSALNQLLNRWADELKRIQPGIEIEVTGGGSGTAPPALLDGVAELAPMSRLMNQNERNAFRAKFGYEPTQITVGIDALAVYVNKNNPLTKISLRDLDALYSLTRKRGGREIKTWGDLGATGDWASKPIRVYGPQPTQGMHGLFRAEILQGGEYRYDMQTEPVASAIVQSVGADDLAIGFASHSLANVRTKALAVSEEPSATAVEPSHQSVIDGSYPLARKLVIYVNRKPDAALDPAVAELLRFACSKRGQAIAIELNAYPLSAALAERECLSALK
jgi:phosphate transport system substrate-binding protein